MRQQQARTARAARVQRTEQLALGYISSARRPHHSSAPLPPCPPLVSHPPQAVCGSHHTLALTEDGHVYSWGSNLLGQVTQSAANNRNKPRAPDALQLGHGRIPGMEETDSENRPRRVEELARHRVVRLFCGFDSCAAMTSDGAVFVWGGGRLGQLGLGRSNLRDVSLPVRLKLLSPHPFQLLVSSPPFTHLPIYPFTHLPIYPFTQPCACRP